MRVGRVSESSPEPGGVMRVLTALVVAVLSCVALADGGKTITYQTLPNSNIRDYRAPAYVTEGNVTYKTLPNSTFRDYRAPAYVTKGAATHKTLPGSTIRDDTAPAYRRAR